MSQTTTTQAPVQSFYFDPQAWDYIRPQVREYVVLAVLPCALYGMFVLLCGASMYSLIRNRRRNQNQLTTLVLSLTVVSLFCSTTVYTVATLQLELEKIYSQVVNGFELWSSAVSPGMILTGSPALSSEGMRQFVYCAPTAALTINILLGDAIVCWRACVLWQGNRIVKGVCIVLLFTTFALGIVDTKYSCLQFGLIYIGGPPRWKPDPHANGTGSLYEGFSYGIAATALSLSTNVFATVAVAVKAWRSRKVLKRYMVTGAMSSQMEKVLSLLVESGTLYCTLWVVVLAWQAGNYEEVRWMNGDNSFWDIFNVIINGALVPLIAIYPTIIIVLVALNRSHFETGFMNSSSSSAYRFPLRPVAVVVKTTTHSDSHTRGSAESVIAIGEEGFPSGYTEEGSKAYAPEE